MRYMPLLLLLVCTSCLAANQLFIFFINGVNTTPDEADLNLSKIESIVDVDSNQITWNVLYNTTHGLMRSDIWDVVRQKHSERLGLDYSKYHDLYPENSLSDYLADRNYSGMNLSDIVSQFHKRIPTINKDTYVLIISHSQGNQYANQLWDYLVYGEGFPQSQIGLIGIASPADKGYGDNFHYITANNDKVINMARIFPAKPLDANAHIEDCHDFSCHNLIKDYLGDETIRNRICKHIGSFMNLWLNTQPLC